MSDYSSLNQNLPLAFQTDYESLKNAQIKAAYLNSSDQAGGLLSAHTWVTFVTKDDKVILARGGAANEPVASSFGSAVGKRAVGAEGDETLGRLVATMGYMAEKSNGNDKRSNAEDLSIPKKPGVLDTVNYKSVQQGKGMDGLVSVPNVRTEMITNDPAKAQTLFNAALDVTAQTNRKAPEYRMVPSSGTLPIMKILTGLKRKLFDMAGQNHDNVWASGANSHSFTSWVMQKGDDLFKKLGTKPEFVNTFSNFLAYEIAPGSSVSRVVGSGLPNVESLSKEPSYKPVEEKGIKSSPSQIMNYADPVVPKTKTVPHTNGGADAKAPNEKVSGRMAKYAAVLPVIGLGTAVTGALLSTGGKALASTGNSIDRAVGNGMDRVGNELSGLIGLTVGAIPPDGTLVKKASDAIVASVDHSLGRNVRVAQIEINPNAPHVTRTEPDAARTPAVNPVSPPIS